MVNFIAGLLALSLYFVVGYLVIVFIIGGVFNPFVWPTFAKGVFSIWVLGWSFRALQVW